MIEDKELGLKISESPRETLIYRTMKNTEERILQLELGLELEKVALEYLKNKKE